MKRKFARHCRELMHAARSAEVREQLRLWAEELDKPADAPDQPLAAHTASQPPETVDPMPRT